jgi:PDZ domain-containing secreted protein
MKTVTRCCGVLMAVAVLVGGCAAVTRSAATPPFTLLIRNVTVIDATGAAPKPGMSVFITGDRITAINGKPVKTSDDLFYGFEAAGVGANVTLTVVRGRAPREVKVTLVAMD